jgi:hypothetical protein
MLSLNSLLLYGGIALGAIALVGGIYWIGHSAGSSACELNNSNAIIDTTTKTKKVYDKIDKATPYNAADAVIDKWLLAHTRADQ